MKVEHEILLQCMMNKRRIQDLRFCKTILSLNSSLFSSTLSPDKIVGWFCRTLDHVQWKCFLCPVPMFFKFLFSTISACSNYCKYSMAEFRQLKHLVKIVVKVNKRTVYDGTWTLVSCMKIRCARPPPQPLHPLCLATCRHYFMNWTLALDVNCKVQKH